MHYKYIILAPMCLQEEKNSVFVLINIKHITVDKIIKKIVVTKMSIDFSLKNRIAEFTTHLKRKNQMFRLFAYSEKLSFLVRRIHCFLKERRKKESFFMILSPPAPPLFFYENSIFRCV